MWGTCSLAVPGSLCHFDKSASHFQVLVGSFESDSALSRCLCILMCAACVFFHECEQNMTLLEMLHVAAEERAGVLPMDIELDEEGDEDEADAGEGPSITRTFGASKPQAKIVLSRDGSATKM